MCERSYPAVFHPLLHEWGWMRGRADCLAFLPLVKILVQRRAAHSFIGDEQDLSPSTLQ